MNAGHFSEFEARMKQAGMGEAIIRAFQHSYDILCSGRTGMIPESALDPVADLPRLEINRDIEVLNPTLVRQTVVVKLNGGLGTSMGLDRPKSLLTVKPGLSFLDIIARQILHLRQTTGVPLRFLLMNSFSTSTQTLEWLAQHPELGTPKEVELMQNVIPKVDAATLRPARWPAQPELEWCPPGHGDLYPSLVGSGWLDRLLGEGIRFLFVSNADNLGATLEGSLLQYFKDSEKSFLMEVCERTAADHKGGHLALRNGQLLLREFAQCPEPDQPAFQDITRHRFFNTNNLWLRLDRLREWLHQNGGRLPLPVMQNAKTVDPRDPGSPAVIQLETAMGAAIECFSEAAAIVVPRSRFAPVKTTADLLAVRSDAYALTADFRVTLDPGREGAPPTIELDSPCYKLVDQLESSLQRGVPSLKNCDSLRVEGPVDFQDGTTLRGNVTLINRAPSRALLAAQLYENTTVILPPGGSASDAASKPSPSDSSR